MTDQPSLLKELEAAIQAPVPPLQALVLPAAAAIVDGIAEKLGGSMSAPGAANAAIAAGLLRGLPAVPPSAACSFKQEGSVGFDIQTASGSIKVVISTDPRCLQAVSSAGGRVTVAASTGQRVYDQMNR